MCLMPSDAVERKLSPFLPEVNLLPDVEAQKYTRAYSLSSQVL